MIGFSEFLAIVPYLLRALRIKKLFDAREVYCDTDKMPKKEIWNWREGNVIKWFMIGLISFSVVTITAEMVCIYHGGKLMILPNINSVSQPMSKYWSHDALFVKENINASFNRSNLTLTIFSFFEYVLLMIAIYH